MKTVIKGRGASAGVTEGEVQIIKKPSEIYKFKSGRILVTETSNPAFTIVFTRANAIVTDRGAINCHAAIVAREFGIPCVVATDNATKVLKNNMKVIVDGSRGEVYEK